MKVLVVDDEVRLADALGELFRRNKIIADVVYEGEDGYFYAKKGARLFSDESRSLNTMRTWVLSELRSAT